MKPKTTIYNLEICQIQQPYRNQESLEHATRLDLFECVTPFGQFHVGETVADGPGMTYLGRIQHSHHSIGGVGDGQILHSVAIYLHSDD